MKLRYPIIGIIILLISTTIWEHMMGPELYKAIGMPITTILFLALLGLIAYLVLKIIAKEILGEIIDEAQSCVQRTGRRREQKARQARMVQDINRELDEIEASLNTVTLNEKVTPIWKIPTKKT